MEHWQNSTRKKEMKVMFVCTGNTCRSCMAEGIFRAVSGKKSEIADFVASSRGIQAFDGDSASEHSVTALKKLWNIDISLHKAKLLYEEDMEEIDLMLTMTRQHRDFLKTRYPNKKNKIFTLKEYAFPELGADAEVVDITDPFGMPYHRYESCAYEIYDSVQAVLNQLSDNVKY